MPFRAGRTEPTESPVQPQSLGEQLRTSTALSKSRGNIPSCSRDPQVLPARGSCTAGAALQKEHQTQVSYTSILKAEQVSEKRTGQISAQISAQSNELLKARSTRINSVPRNPNFIPTHYIISDLSRVNYAALNRFFVLSYFIQRVNSNTKSFKEVSILQNLSCHCKSQSRYLAQQNASPFNMKDHSPFFSSHILIQLCKKL